MKAPGSLADLTFVREILEIRYPKSHRYWDVSGSILAQVEARLPVKFARLGPFGFEFSGSGCGLESGLFYWDQVRLDVDRASASQFESSAAAFWSIVASAFELDALTRVGNRYAYLFETADAAKADAMLSERRIWSLCESLAVLGEADARGTALRTVLKDHDRRIRLEVAPGDATVAGKSRSGIVLDVDFSNLEDATVKSLDVAAFVSWNQRFVKDNLHKVLRVKP